MIGRTNAGGGAAIKFKVVGGTVRPQGKENLVWVNTSTAISNWVVSPIQPEPAEWLVWIETGRENAVNVIRRNVLEVCPINCKQYLAGKWKRVEAQLFSGGDWERFSTEWEGIVFDGNGWTDAAEHYTSNVSISGGQLHFADYRKNVSGTAYIEANVSGFSTITFNGGYYSSGIGSDIEFGLFEAGSWTRITGQQYIGTGGYAINQTFEIPDSTGECRIGFRVTNRFADEGATQANMASIILR